MLTSAPLVVLVSCLTATLCAKMPQYEFVEEWKMWKGQHEKSYASELEELDRHLVWISNKKFIELHNANSHIFGYNLAMDHYGDLVRQTLCVVCVCACEMLFCNFKILSLLSISMPM